MLRWTADDHAYLEEAINSGDKTTINLLRFGLIVVVLDRSSLRAPEDDGGIEANANLKTASRVLDHVYAESGHRYGDVVARCLLWSER
ncbi:hypothetical protein FOPE_01695 [Fonsecaea pedrosoi]|nr:hypothetical protein FOPE_01695 [Fonsecaea pedrosoi]